MSLFSLLVDRLPATVDIGGRAVPIATGHRTGVLCEALLWDEALTAEERALGVLGLYFTAPEAFAAALAAPAETLEQALGFYRGAEACVAGACVEEDDAPGSLDAGSQGPAAAVGATVAPLYDLEQDGPLIYAAFLADYGLDLTERQVHWWAFRALLGALRPENLFCRVVGWRGAELSKLKGEERVFYARMQRQWALRRPHRPAENAALEAVAAALRGGGDVTGALMKAGGQAGAPNHDLQ